MLKDKKKVRKQEHLDYPSEVSRNRSVLWLCYHATVPLSEYLSNFSSVAFSCCVLIRWLNYFKSTSTFQPLSQPQSQNTVGKCLKE